MLFTSVLNSRNILVNNGKLSALFTKFHHYTLNSGHYLQSKNGKFELKMETNCNLIVHHKNAKKQTFATNTAGKGTKCKAIVEKNGNFVVKSSEGKVVWGTNTVAKRSGPYKLIMKNNGNLILYHKKSCMWASKKCPLPRKLKGLNASKAVKAVKKEIKKKMKQLKKPQFKAVHKDKTKPKVANKKPRAPKHKPTIKIKTSKNQKKNLNKAKNLLKGGKGAWGAIKSAVAKAIKGKKGKGKGKGKGTGKQIAKLKKEIQKGTSFAQLKEIAAKKAIVHMKKQNAKAKTQKQENKKVKKPKTKKALKKGIKKQAWMVEIKNVFNKKQQHSGAGWNKIVAILKKNNFKGNASWFKTVRRSVNKGYSKFVNSITTTPVPKITKIKTKTPVSKPTPIQKSPVRYTPVQYVYVYRPSWKWIIRSRSYLTYYWRGYYSLVWYVHCWRWWWWTFCRWALRWQWNSYPYWYWASYNYWSLEFY
jgi:hypothetical protein